MNDDTASAVLQPLRPWLDLLMTGRSSCAFKNPSLAERGVVFTFDVSLYQTDELHNESTTVKLREAIDLAYRALAVHTATVLFFWEESEFGSGSPMHDAMEDPIKRHLMLDTPFEMKVNIHVGHVVDAALLKRMVADTFFVSLSQTPSTDAAYLAARAHIDALLKAKNPAWAQSVEPIEMTCSVKMPQNFELTTHESEGFFEQMAAFMSVLDNYEPGALVAGGHLVVKLNSTSIHLAQTPITPGICASVSAMLNMRRVSLNTTHLVIDPRLVRCSRAELGVFLRALRASVVNVLPLGLDIAQVPIPPMDNQVDTTVFLRDLLLPIIDCETVETVHVGGLITLFVEPQSRSEIYQVLVDTALIRAQPLRLVVDHGNVREVDARAFSSIAQVWKTNHPHAKFRLQQLTLDVFDLDGALASAFVDVLDEARELSITNRRQDAPAISPRLVAHILDKFSMLRSLSLGHVNLETMHLFSEKAPPTIESLTLRGFHVEDRHSFLEFTKALGHRNRALSQQLRHLKISNFALSDAPTVFGLLDQEVDYLVEALRENRALETLVVQLDSRFFLKRFRQSCVLQSSAGSVVPAPSNIRRSNEEKQRRIAFLSILRAIQARSQVYDGPELDSFLVRHIFDFSDPWVPRSVRTN